MRYSVEPKGKGSGFLSFAKNMGKRLSSKFEQTFLVITKNLATSSLKASTKRTDDPKNRRSSR